MTLNLHKRFYMQNMEQVKHHWRCVYAGNNVLTVPQAILMGLWSLGLLFGNVSDVLIYYSHFMKKKIQS